MNSISWFLYAVDVLGGISKIVEILGFCVGVGTVLYLIAMAVIHVDIYDDDKQKIHIAQVWKQLKINIKIFLIASLIGAVIPSSKTMYLIMGSEVSEEIVTSETGQRVQDAINKKLDEYLSDERE